MKISFEHMGELLADPFFEARQLGRDAIRQRTSPVDGYGGAPGIFRFAEWTAEDDRCTVGYYFHNTAIGRLLLADTHKGLCFLGFARAGGVDVMADFARRFPRNRIEERAGGFQTSAAAYCNGDTTAEIALHLRGTGFQIAIWRQLVRIPRGRLSTYGSLAPGAGGARAAGAAVGANPVSYIVPCHRVVRSDGGIDGYHWGADIKKQLLACEFQDEFRNE